VAGFGAAVGGGALRLVGELNLGVEAGGVDFFSSLALDVGELNFWASAVEATKQRIKLRIKRYMSPPC
jgi:hypothetical protein